MKKAMGLLLVLAMMSAGCTEKDKISLDLGDGTNIPMVLIPGGTNSGYDPNGWTYSLTVSTFYMDRTEVTKAQWDAIYNWAVANGYDFDNPGLGKASDHPVHTVSWYDVVKWCNARSEMNGKTPCYTVSGSTYKARQSEPDCNFEANGYRLPTNTEWEYAARGGLSDKRFPWGDTITHGEANYKSHDNYSFDTSFTRDYHPAYNDGTKPYTSPVGSFGANGYGLCDMSGNLWEWCNDVFVTASGSGPSFRGGGWDNYADSAGCIGALYCPPDNTNSSLGFRAVCRSKEEKDTSVDLGGGSQMDKAPKEEQVHTVDLGDGISMEFLPIPAGSFMMGSENGADDEKPVHQVTISKPFWMAKTEVTQAQWKQVMSSNPSGFKGDILPVEQVSWNDAMDFCKKLTERERQAGLLPEGFAYTLPTEAQWEYACRAGSTGDYAGNLDAMAWCAENSDYETHAVDKKQANAWGFHDMHGNVWEWCLDWEGDYPSGIVVDPGGPSSGSFRVIRGGHWGGYYSESRSANRGSGSHGSKYSNLVFRPLAACRS